MKDRREIVGNPRVKNVGKAAGFDCCELHGRHGTLLCMWGDDEDGWEHVSVSPKGSKSERDQPCPTWAQMCEAKKAFWGDDEMVVQVHPSEDKYLHGPAFDTNILHLWRPKDGDWSNLEGVMDV